VDTETKFFNSPQLNKGSFHAFKNLKAPLDYVITRSSDDYLVKERVRICSLDMKLVLILDCIRWMVDEPFPHI